MPMQTTAFMPCRNIGKEMGGLKGKFFIDFHGH